MTENDIRAHECELLGALFEDARWAQLWGPGDVTLHPCDADRDAEVLRRRRMPHGCAELDGLLVSGALYGRAAMLRREQIRAGGLVRGGSYLEVREQLRDDPRQMVLPFPPPGPPPGG